MHVLNVAITGVVLGHPAAEGSFKVNPDLLICFGCVFLPDEDYASAP